MSAQARANTGLWLVRLGLGAYNHFSFSNTMQPGLAWRAKTLSSHVFYPHLFGIPPHYQAVPTHLISFQLPAKTDLFPLVSHLLSVCTIPRTLRRKVLRLVLIFELSDGVLGLFLSRRLEYNAMLVGLQMRLMALYPRAA